MLNQTLKPYFASQTKWFSRSLLSRLEIIGPEKARI